MASRYRTWGVRLPSGQVKVYGDQAYVRDGRVLEDHPGGTLVVCDVDITVGAWRDPAGSDALHPTFAGVLTDGHGPRLLGEGPVAFRG